MLFDLNLNKLQDLGNVASEIMKTSRTAKSYYYRMSKQIPWFAFEEFRLYNLGDHDYWPIDTSL